MTETVQMNQTGHRSKIFIGAFIAMLIGSAILLLTLFMYNGSVVKTKI